MADKNYEKTAKEILEAVGGKENVVSGAHCATRLRLVLKDDSKINKDKLDNIELVKGSFNNAGQFQIILGTGIVNEVFKFFSQAAELSEVGKEELKEIAAKKANVFQRILKSLADVFVPILPALVASGLLMGINNVLTSKGLFVAGKTLIEVFPQFTDLANMINLFSNAAFVFLPVLIGFHAAKNFGGTPVLGAVIGAIMIHPDLLNGYGYGEALAKHTIPYWNIFGLNIAQVGYQGTVLPIIASSFILAKIETFTRKYVPAILDMIITPLVSVLLTSFITFTVIGPIMRVIGDGVVYPLLVITGMHHSMAAAEMQILANISKLGGSPTFAVVSASNVAQGAAALACFFFMKKDKKIQSVASAAGISALLGITEPAVFGVNLNLKFPFLAALIGSAVGSGYAVWMKVLSVSQGPAGIPGVIVMRPQSMIQFLVSITISFVVTFIVTYLFVKIFNRKGGKNNGVA